MPAGKDADNSSRSARKIWIMNWSPRIPKRIFHLRRFFVFYRKPKYLRKIQRWLNIRPEDIPAIETFDADRLCKTPLVSVLIITYNQKKFIRHAIESAVAQKSDFDYEILIGDDCSTDGTGAICAEYQKRYPDKIRFITADRNVSKLGGNLTRLIYRVRGEFVALLEGDDYWTDSEKLQKQVDVFRHHPDVTLCLTSRETLKLDGTLERSGNAHFDALLAASSEEDGTLFGSDDYFAHPLGGPIGTAMYRNTDIDFDEMCTFYFRTSFTYYFLLLKKGKGYLLSKPMIVYRVNPNGVWSGKTPMEQARFAYEYFTQLLLHAPENKAIKHTQKYWWRQFRRHLFPWCLLVALKGRFRWRFSVVLGCLLVLFAQAIVPAPNVRAEMDKAHEIIFSLYLSPDGTSCAPICRLWKVFGRA